MNKVELSATRSANRKDWVISICVFLSGFSCFAQLYYFQPLLPDLATEFGLLASGSSLAVSFSTLGMVAGLCTAMFVADSICRKKLISFALLASSLTSIVCSYSPTFAPLVALLVVLVVIAASGGVYLYSLHASAERELERRRIERIHHRRAAVARLKGAE